jgi:small-conductance mechanosensitive channel
MIMLQQDVPRIVQIISPQSALTVVVIIAAAWLAIRWNWKAFEFLSARFTRGGILFKRGETVIRAIVCFYATYLTLQVLAPSRETSIALMASIGLAVSLGAKDLVRDIVGGLVILMDRPYQVGDLVRIGDAYGEIEHIGLRSTRLTTSDDMRVTIPNSEILNGKLYNANSGVPDCQVVTDIIVPHNADPGLLIPLGYEAAHSSPFRMLDRPVVVEIVDRFDREPYAILRVKGYAFNHRSESRMQSDITVRVKSELLRLGIVKSLRAANVESAF